MEIVKRITPEKAIEILENNGLNVSFDQAEKILDFLYRIINATFNQSLKDEDS